MPSFGGTLFGHDSILSQLTRLRLIYRHSPTWRVRNSNVGQIFFSSIVPFTEDIFRASVSVVSPEIAKASLRVYIPWQRHIYGYPFLSLYPLLAYAYFFKYNQWLASEEWTFLACVTLGVGHALSYLVTRWNSGARAWITTREVRICHQSLAGLSECHLASSGGVLGRGRLYPRSPSVA
jgi:hypothetical protein